MVISSSDFESDAEKCSVKSRARAISDNLACSIVLPRMWDDHNIFIKYIFIMRNVIWILLWSIVIWTEDNVDIKCHKMCRVKNVSMCDYKISLQYFESITFHQKNFILSVPKFERGVKALPESEWRCFTEYSKICLSK